MPKDIMAIGDLEVCDAHQDCLVALFCQTCEELICTRCVCQGPHSASPHRDHVYLDIMEAFDIHKEDIEKLQGQVKDIVVRTKTSRQDAQNRLNKMKLELLGRRSLVERRKRALVDRVEKDESTFMKAIEEIVKPSVENEEQRVRDLDYQAVSREGFLGHLDSLSRMSSKESRAFLKNFVRLKRQLEDLIKESQSEEAPPGDAEEQQRHVRSVNLNLHAAMRATGRAFHIPLNVPGPPRIIFSWCVIGSNSATLVWKHTDGVKVDRVRIYFRREANEPSEYNLVSVKHHTGRCHAVLRNLEADASYDVRLCGVNVCGEGEGATATFRTSPRSKEEDHRIWSTGKADDASLGLRRKFNWKPLKKTFYSLIILAVFMIMAVALILLTVERIICERLVGNIKSHSAVDICSMEQRKFLHSQLTACDAPSGGQDYAVPPSGLYVRLAQWWQQG